MFINCPHCRALVATDLATGLPPERCPRCAQRLREAPQPQAVAPATETVAASEPRAAEPVSASSSATAPASASVATPVSAPTPTSTTTASSVTPPQPAAQRELPADDPALIVTLPGTPPPAPLSAPAAPEPRTFVALLKTAAPAAATAFDAAPLAPPGERAGSHAAPPAAADAIAPQTPPSGEPAAPVESSPAEISSENADAVTPPSSPARESAVAPKAKPAPSFARAADAPETVQLAHGWKLPAAVAALALALGLQLLLADRDRLAMDAGWRPVVSALCGVLRCALPPWREPAAFVLVDRDVQSHPNKSGVLRVTATFRNEARWAQPWPRLQLTLSDVNGNPVAARVFTESEYLGAAPAQPLLASGQSASIAMDIVEPSKQSVAFDFALQ
ncbi:DUF3426 domain-containing protein [Luteimonas aquatica]|uniref:DUF3426 domain-containing protein n=1 Tax=Luteimonas aquatica TaxID=450364 RepID=UPI001F57CD84|nr:DUF3426 domain-containing protein [Luteimonas aquatica]